MASSSPYSTLSYTQPLAPRYTEGLALPDLKDIGNGDYSGREGQSDLQHYLASKLPQGDRREVEQEYKKTLVLAAQKPKVARRKAKRKGGGQLTAGERRAAGLTRLPRKGLVFSSFQPLHHLWSSYMLELLDLGGLEQQGWSPNLLEEPRQLQLQTRLCRCFNAQLLVTRATVSPV